MEPASGGRFWDGRRSGRLTETLPTQQPPSASTKTENAAREICGVTRLVSTDASLQPLPVGFDKLAGRFTLRRLIEISYSTREVAVRSSIRRGTDEGARPDRSSAPS